jgi:hypothetical protein
MKALMIGRMTLLLATLIMAIALPVQAGSWLQGHISLELDDGRVESGEFLRIYLVSRALPIGSLEDQAQAPPREKIERINDAHMKFYHQFIASKNEPGYLIKDTESTQAGAFLFTDIEAGGYTLLVTFPSMIAGYKVAWQIPVQVAAKGINHVVLDRGNLALPAVKRRAPVLFPK